ncbi:hypothetical protein [Nocardia fluminea]|uniref:Uncharacterized protein n=1 Tax=Nocardia fluminea TaxID=134984 RepID=A0A2N3V7Z5_9NOCA|nr:hypothetical protein [Nocardia fluminea]PKV77740.1 hypothetical protein ATK86_2093 [Nocardia fluminea]
MTNSDTQSSSPRALFAHRFAELYAAAGNPTLRRVATATERRMRGTQAATPSPQRISDWKTGRNVPARFESLLPVVLTLVELTEQLVIVTGNGELGVWDLDAETVAARICASTGRLTEAVWRGKVANVAYRSPCP